MYDSNKAHYVVVTVIVIKDGKYLIAKRSPNEKAFPNLWTVPGGKLEQTDYTNRPKDTHEHWYNVLEDLLRREISEETNLEVANIRYVTSLVYHRSDGIPTLIISLAADYAGGEIILSEELTEHAWVTLEEAQSYDLIEGIYEEILTLDKLVKGESADWHKVKKLLH